KAEQVCSLEFCHKLDEDQVRCRLADVYTSRVPNMLKYDLNHCFFPRRNALPHENLHSVPIHTDCILDLVKQKEQVHNNNVHIEG
ncbi:hypothetical protein ANCDUO_27050, partial [Ancylostoma duodenale]